MLGGEGDEDDTASGLGPTPFLHPPQEPLPHQPFPPLPPQEPLPHEPFPPPLQFLRQERQSLSLRPRHCDPILYPAVERNPAWNSWPERLTLWKKEWKSIAWGNIWVFPSLLCQHSYSQTKGMNVFFSSGLFFYIYSEAIALKRQ